MKRVRVTEEIAYGAGTALDRLTGTGPPASAPDKGEPVEAPARPCFCGVRRMPTWRGWLRRRSSAVVRK